MLTYPELNDTIFRTPAEASLFNSYFCIDVLFVDMIFVEGCFVNFDTEFEKSSDFKEHQPIMHLKYLQDVLLFILNNNLELQAALLMKCLIFRDSLCYVSYPSCCNFTRKCGNLLGMICEDGIRNTQVYEFLFKGFVELKKILSADKTRINDLHKTFEILFYNIYQLFKTVDELFTYFSENAINELKTDDGSFGFPTLLQILYQLDYPAERSWKRSVVRFHNPKLMAYVYASALDDDILIRKGILHEIEKGLEKTHEFYQFQNSFQEMMKALSSDNSEPFFYNLESLVLSTAYFDVLNLCDDNLNSLFRTNIQILFMLDVAGNESDADLEEGEDIEPLNDIVGAYQLFLPKLLEYEKDRIRLYSEGNFSQILPNILLFGQALTPTVIDPAELKRLRAEMFDRWNFIVNSIPPFVFKASMNQIWKEYYPSDTTKHLDYLLIDYTFSHPLGLTDCFEPLLSLLNEQNKNNLGIGIEPCNSYISHFDKLERKGEVTKYPNEMKFLYKLANEFILQIPFMEIPPVQLKKYGKKKSGQRKNYEFLSKSFFPGSIVGLLKKCILNAPVYIQKHFCRYLLDSIKYGKTDESVYDPFEVLIISLIECNYEPSQLCDLLVECLIYPTEESLETKTVSFRMFELSFSLPWFQSYFLGRTNYTKRESILNDLLAYCNEDLDHNYEKFKAVVITVLR